MVEPGDQDDEYFSEGDWDLALQHKASSDFPWATEQTEEIEDIRVMRLEELKPSIQSRVRENVDLLGIDEDKIYLVAKHYFWNQERIDEKWFDQQEKLQYDLGLYFRPGLENSKKLNVSLRANLDEDLCLICYEELGGNELALACGHTFCKDCWKEHVQSQVKNPDNPTVANCMQAGCNLKVPHSLFLELLEGNPALADEYWKWMARQFTDSNPSIRWCPQPGCGHFFQKISLNDKPTHKCKCGKRICMRCGSEAHAPAECFVLLQWEEKAQAESENVNWIKAFTKPCPACHKPIEKNQGCNHMTCAQCKHQFCWLCLINWKEHCTTYKCRDVDLSSEGLKNFESNQNMAKNELKRYMHHFERFMNHEKVIKHAEKLRPVLLEKTELLNTVKGYPSAELDFMIEGVDEVQCCALVAKWTHAYAYYAELKPQQKAQFDFWQLDLENYSDKLMGLVEKDLEEFLDPENIDMTPFYLYKSQLVSFYTATKKYRENLMKGCEDFTQYETQ